MGNNSTKQQYIDNIKNNKNDPYIIFNLSKDFTWEELRASYKNLAIKSHPDKGGDKIIFDFITDKFKFLANEYKLRTDNKSHLDLKKEYSSFSDNINIPQFKEDDDMPFNAKFNSRFEQCKIYDEDKDFGYGNNMIDSSKNREDISIENIFKTKKINNRQFNETFNTSVNSSSKIIKYKEPQALILAKNLQYSEIGKGKTDDYSSSAEKTNSLAYTDYFKAHSTNRLVSPQELKNFKEYKSVEEYEKYSNKKIKKKLSSSEIKRIDEIKKNEEIIELQRLERLKKQSIDIEKNYEKANRLFLR
tara:strand:- start:1834 stop:2742 length:909 start_codon:yes stop_codon:yes gene_type:complete